MPIGFFGRFKHLTNGVWQRFKRFTNSFETLCKPFANSSQTLLNPFANASQTLFKCFAKPLQVLRKPFANASLEGRRNQAATNKTSLAMNFCFNTSSKIKRFICSYSILLESAEMYLETRARDVSLCFGPLCLRFISQFDVNVLADTKREVKYEF